MNARQSRTAERLQDNMYRELCRSCADQLESVVNLRAGLMDSESKQIEVQRQIKQTIEHVIARLRS